MVIPFNKLNYRALCRLDILATPFTENSAEAPSSSVKPVHYCNIFSYIFQEEDLRRTLEDSACLQRAYDKYIDMTIVNEDFDQTFRKVLEALETLSVEHQWVPVNWVY